MIFPEDPVIVDLIAAGARGPAGSQFLDGTGAPASGLGSTGDLYFDLTTGLIYGPKASGAWGSPTPLSAAAQLASTNDPANPGHPYISAPTVEAMDARYRTFNNAAATAAGTTAGTAAGIAAASPYATAAAGSATAAGASRAAADADAAATAADRVAVDAMLQQAAAGGGINQWYVSATGSSGNPGTKVSPWSAAWACALANTTIQPGDVVWWMDTGGRYPANTVIYSRGTTLKPVTHAVLSGHNVEISGALPAYEGVANQTAWTLIDAGMQIYETNVVPSATTNNRDFHGFIWTENDWHTLMPDRWGGLTPSTPAISQASHLYRTDGVFYPGPMLMPLTNGKVRVRLQNSTAAAMRNKPTTQITDPNPANNTLKLYDSNSVGFTVRGSNLVFRGFAINDVYNAFYIDIGSGPVENITIEYCSSRMGFTFIRGSSARSLTLRYNKIDGKMGTTRHWIGFSEVKGAATLGERMRKCALSLDGVVSGSVYGNKITGFFDGILGGALYDVEIGKFPATVTGNITVDEAAAWTYANTFSQIIDDGMQIYSSDQKVHAHHNYWYGAGPNLDGDGSGAYHGDEFPIIHHNVIDPRRNPIWWQREPDPTDPNFATTDPVGIRYPAPFGGHGLQNTAGWYYPIQYYQNTVYFVPNYVPNRFESWQANFNRGTGGLPSPFKHVIGNNLILVEPTGNWGWMAREVTFDAGREVYDGNLIVKPDATFNAVYRFGYRGGSSVAPGNGVATFVSLQTENSGLDWAATKVGYTPGWDANSLQLSQSPVGAITDGGAPTLTQAKTGAADLTALSLPGLSTYHPWRGAKAALS